MTAPLATADLTVPVFGTYKMKLVKNGPRVPVKVFEEGARDENGDPLEDITLVVIVNGKRYDHAEKWIERINTGAVEISDNEYQYLIDIGEWSKTFSPDDPAANPRKVIDYNAMKPLF